MSINLVKDFMSALVSKGTREDNRGLFDYRDIQIEVNPLERACGSAKVTIGDTQVLVGVKMDVGEPFPDTPEEGILMVNAELSPLASPDFESGPPKFNSIELARVVDRGIRESHCIDTSKLCIKPKEKVWMVFVDIYPLNASGNLLDAAAIGAIVALQNAVFPVYDEAEEKVKYKEFTKEKLPIERTPVMATFAKINGTIFLDPSYREEEVMDARISITTTEKGLLAAMQKGGKGTFTFDEVAMLVDKAFEIGDNTRKLV